MFQTNILFGIPIYKIKIDPNSYDKENLLSTIKKNYSLGPRNKYDFYNSKMHMSYDDEDNEKFENMNYSKLKKVYDNIFNEFVKKLKLNYKGHINLVYDILNYTVSNKDNYMGFHNHLPNDDFACVHYLQMDKNHLGTQFENTQKFGKYYRYMRPYVYDAMDNKEEINSFVFDTFTLDVEEDDMVIFPTVADHGIKKIDTVSDKLRITIATNLTLNFS